MAIKSGAALRREEIKKQYFELHDLWLAEKEVGWFAVPRTFPLILSLLDSKEISGKKSSSSVYLELLSRHRSDGIVEMGQEGDHAFCAGYQGSRAVRTWRERMQTLEKNHFIVTKQVGNERFAYVALVHPTTVIQKLFEGKRVPEPWMAAYLRRKLETKEPTHEKRMEKLKQTGKVVPIATVAKTTVLKTRERPKGKRKA